MWREAPPDRDMEDLRDPFQFVLGKNHQHVLLVKSRLLKKQVEWTAMNLSFNLFTVRMWRVHLVIKE